MNELCPMPGCRVDAITPVGPNLLHIAVHGTRSGGRCPDCGRASRAVHSRYRRHPADLPSMGRRIHVGLRVRRFYCRNAKRARRTFAKRLPELVAPHARRTTRLADFTVDWDRKAVRCPKGKESGLWISGAKHRGPGDVIHVQFRAAARARQDTAEDKRLYAQRNGVEGTLSQAVRTFGLRQARYRGLAKTGLQGVATAASLNLDRIAAWFARRPLAPTRTSRFAALAA